MSFKHISLVANNVAVVQAQGRAAYSGPHPEERPQGRVSKDGRGEIGACMVRDGALRLLTMRSESDGLVGEAYDDAEPG
ncbi:hypothetical protein XI07_19215 [Bradyrhizobium sp. CCBAU 11445]|nr:hypothetical protein [Bradyrhizobium sp. CCBAU 25360]MDA9484096.1 hypothetical protein [Bradyrhizobium sp. CCBAU 11445]